jgi:hypothetical protein
MTELWTGYSFMFVDAGQDNKWAQNLGDAGSCMREFRRELFAECAYDKCFRYSGQHKTNWLAVAADPGDYDFVRSLPRGGFNTQEKIDQYISRCVVCETIFKLVVVHSKTRQNPRCPDDYNPVKNPSRHIPNGNGAPVEEMWHGYSFWQVSSYNFGMGANSESAASCLTHFSPTPIAACESASCKIAMTDRTRNFWQMSQEVAVNDYEDFFESTTYISRCTVCRRPEAPHFLQRNNFD